MKTALDALTSDVTLNRRQQELRTTWTDERLLGSYNMTDKFGFGDGVGRRAFGVPDFSSRRLNAVYRNDTERLEKRIAAIESDEIAMLADVQLQVQIQAIYEEKKNLRAGTNGTWLRCRVREFGRRSTARVGKRTRNGPE